MARARRASSRRSAGPRRHTRFVVFRTPRSFASGAEAAFVRMTVQEPDREQLMEAEIRAVGRNRVRMNRHPLARARDLLGLVRVTVFAPDDLQLVKGGPAGRPRRTWMICSSRSRRATTRSQAEFDRVLKHRNALLRQGLRGPDAESTLVVFDEQLVRAGSELVRGRLRLTARLLPAVRDAYRGLAGEGDEVDADYEAEWAEGSVTPTAEDVEPLLRARCARGATRGRGGSWCHARRSPPGRVAGTSRRARRSHARLPG